MVNVPKVDDLPECIQEPEEHFRWAKQRWETARDQLTLVRGRLVEQKRLMVSNLPYKKYQQVKSQHDADLRVMQKLQLELGELRSLARFAALDAHGMMFRFIAGRMVDADTCRRIDDEVMRILQRPPSADIPKNKGGAHASAEQRIAWDEREKQRLADSRAKRRERLLAATQLPDQNGLAR